jgi:hypothetical protein
MGRKSKLTIATVTAVLAVLGGAAVYAQEKYSLKSPGGIAFSDFRGYEDWAVASSARTTEVLKVIVANPTMINAYKAGVPRNGQPFPDGSMIVKLQWKPKKSTEAPFVVDVPDVFNGKGQQEISENGRMGIRAVQLRRGIGQVHGRSQPRRLRKLVPYGREGEGLHLPPVREALNRMPVANEAPAMPPPTITMSYLVGANGISQNR